jgi:hypothetical protein
MDECSLGPRASIPQSNENANSDFFPTPAFMPPRAPSRLGQPSVLVLASSRLAIARPMKYAM